MFAFFNLGAQEVLILLIMGVLLLMPVGIVLLVLFLVRRTTPTRSSSPLADLRAELENLREEVEELKKGRGEQITPAEHWDQGKKG
jgi:type II secretory pathway component PulM